MVIVVAGIYGWYKFITSPQAKPQNLLPQTCIDQEMGQPIITSLSAYQGSIGDVIEIRGCNFAGFEGDKNVWLENEQGSKAILYGTLDSTPKLIKITLASPLCQQDNSYSGLECESWLELVPGNYKIFVMPWGQESNKVDFIIN